MVEFQELFLRFVKYSGVLALTVYFATRINISLGKLRERKVGVAISQVSKRVLDLR